MSDARVTIEDLSRLIDGELNPAERADLDARLASDPLAVKLLKRMREITNRVAGAILQSDPPPSEAKEGCLDDALMMQLADRALSAETERQVEEHILRCANCLARVLESVRTSTTMRRGRFPDLPPSLQNDKRIRSLVQVREIEPQEICGTVTVELSTDTPARAHFGVAEAYAIDVLLTPTGNDLARAECVILYAHKAKAQVEFALTERGTGKKFFRGLSDASGKILVKRLHPGAYDAHLPAANMLIEVLVKS